MSNQLTEDTKRLEELASEAYEVMAGGVRGCDCFDSLVQIKRFIKKMRSQKKSPIFEFRNQSMGFHVFPFMIDLIMQNSTISLATQPFDENRIAWLIGRYVDFPDILQLKTGESNRNRYVPEWLIRAAFEQLSLQEMARTLVPRTLFLYREIPNNSSSKYYRFIQARDEVLKVQFRVNLEDVLLCTFVLGAIADDSDRFEEKLTTPIKWMKPFLESHAMPIVRSHLAVTRDEYIELSRKEFSGHFTYVKSESPILIEKPIIKFEKYYIAPEPFLLLVRVTKMLHDSVYQYFIDNNRLQEYTSNFGEVYKDYIGLLLRECFGDKNVFDLDTFKTLKGKKSDWLVICENEAGLFECKAQRYPKELKRTGSIEILDSFVNEKIGPALIQLQDTERQWNSIVTELPIAKQVSAIYKYIVFEEHFQFANHMQDFLENNPVVKEMTTSKTLLLSTLELETVACSNYASEFSKVFAAKSNGTNSDLALDQHVRGLPNFKFNPNNILDQKFNEFFHRN